MLAACTSHSAKESGYALQSTQKSLSELMQSGRTRFSVLILDNDLNVKGETMLPGNQYRSNLYFWDE